MEELSYNQMMGQDQAWASDRGLDDVMGPRREFARSSPKGSGSSLGDHRKKTIRLANKNIECYRIGGMSDSCTITA
ncbi:hypothetical protein B296_00056495 [Ensete ventricosum]|uniref:Uncharacterized protein n=1 Tax=Ensete ventricosum TaxID=4639 RepID=A0A426WZ64_ENSVE|nr:hypothetical protein B296_00056495 [Ensete ventricosum]